MKPSLRDFRFGLRQLRKNPGFTAAAAACIALGIGANAALFSVADAFLLRPPNVREPERLVRLFIEWSSGLKFGSFSYPDYRDVRDRNDVLTSLMAETIAPFHVSDADRTEHLWGSLVSANYFTDLGVVPVLGRAFLPEEDRTPRGHPVVILSHGLWQRRYGSPADVAGRSIRLNGLAYTIVGVAPPDFHGVNTAIGPELWVPMMMQAQVGRGESWLEDRHEHSIAFIIGRLKPGVTVAQAQASLDLLMAELAREHPESNTGTSVRVYPESQASLHPTVRFGFAGVVAILFAVVALVLLLACTNVAGLLLARFAARRREIAIRLALGASRGQVAGQLLAESLLLSLVAGGVGLFLGMWLVQVAQRFRPSTDLPLRLDMGLNPAVLGFTFLITVATGIVFGLGPALWAARRDLVPSLKGDSQALFGRVSGMRRVLVAGQVTLSLALLILAGMAAQSLRNARAMSPGFEPDRQLVAAMDLGLQGYDRPTAERFRRDLARRLEALPGVGRVGYAATLPLHLSGSQRGAIPEGYVTPDGSDNPSIDYNVVDPGYFAAMGIPILRGRTFRESDGDDGPPVLVVNEAFAERYWPGRDPLGRTVQTDGKLHQVVGLVPTGKYFSLGEDPKPFMYFSAGQSYRASTFLHVRTAGDPRALIAPLRSAVRELDATLPLYELKTMHEALGFALLPARMMAGAVGGFAALALLLAAVGLYGVIAYMVQQGRREAAIRMALGARPAEVLRGIVGGGLRLVAPGLVLGWVAGVALSRLATSIMYGVGYLNPTALVGATLLLLAAATVAAWLPARQVTRMDPWAALRVE